jgi:thiamine biosynthesis protein ThiS
LTSPGAGDRLNGRCEGRPRCSQSERAAVGNDAGEALVKITLNGEPREFAEPLTIGALLASLRLDARRVAVEHNMRVLKRATFDEVVVAEGDEVEIVNFVGGGASRRVTR